MSRIQRLVAPLALAAVLSPTLALGTPEAAAAAQHPSGAPATSPFTTASRPAVATKKKKQPEIKVDGRTYSLCRLKYRRSFLAISKGGSCHFAENVRTAWKGASANDGFTAWSRQAKKSYPVVCDSERIRKRGAKYRLVGCVSGVKYRQTILFMDRV